MSCLLHLVTCAMRHRAHHWLCILRRAIGLDLSRGSDNDVPGDLKCPAGETIRIGTLDAAQNPSCVKCGGHLQFACSKSHQSSAAPLHHSQSCPCMARLKLHCVAVQGSGSC